MDPKNESTNTEAELESFRQKWREEVTARTNGKAPAAAGPSAKIGTSSRPAKSNAPDASSSTHTRQRSYDLDEVTPHVYHDLGEKQHGRRLDETSAETAAGLAASQEPISALEHYEKAVEKESEGRLGESVSLYRQAFKVYEYRSFSTAKC
jgi:F-box protein 9